MCSASDTCPPFNTTFHREANWTHSFRWWILHSFRPACYQISSRFTVRERQSFSINHVCSILSCPITKMRWMYDCLLHTFSCSIASLRKKLIVEINSLSWIYACLRQDRRVIREEYPRLSDQVWSKACFTSNPPNNLHLIFHKPEINELQAHNCLVCRWTRPRLQLIHNLYYLAKLYLTSTIDKIIVIT